MASTQLSEPPITPTVPSSVSPHEPEPKKGGAVRVVIVAFVILAVVGGVVWKIRSNDSAQTTTNNRANALAADRPQPVLVAAVVQKTMPIYLSALGTVTPYYSVTVKSRVDGQLMSVNVAEGQAVRKGQLLAVIDPNPYEAALAQAQGQLVKDQANAENAKAEAQRYTALLDAGVVSKESQQLQVSTAGQAAGSIAADEAAIQAAKVNLAYTRITSPIDGVVGLRQVDPGNIVHATDTTGLLLVTQLQPTAVIFTLPEDQLPEVLKLVRSGQKLAVEAYDRSNTTALGTGTVLTADNQIDATTGTDKIKSVFANRDNGLFPNQFVNIRLILQQRPNALVVPASAIQTGSQGNFVFVVKQGYPPNSAGAGVRRGNGQGSAASSSAAAAEADSSAEAPAGSTGSRSARGANARPYYVVAQPVKVDVTEGAQVILASGLNPGDQVVIDGQEKLLDGSRVTPRTQDQVAGAGGSGASGAARADSDATAGSADTAAPSSATPHRGANALGTGTDAAAAGRHGTGRTRAGGPQRRQ